MQDEGSEKVGAVVASKSLKALGPVLWTQVSTLVQISPAYSMAPETLAPSQSTSARSLEPIPFTFLGQKRCPVERGSAVTVSKNGMSSHIRSIHTKKGLVPCHSHGTFTTYNVGFFNNHTVIVSKCFSFLFMI